MEYQRMHIFQGLLKGVVSSGESLLRLWLPGRSFGHWGSGFSSSMLPLKQKITKSRRFRLGRCWQSVLLWDQWKEIQKNVIQYILHSENLHSYSRLRALMQLHMSTFYAEDVMSVDPWRDVDDSIRPLISPIFYTLRHEHNIMQIITASLFKFRFISSMFVSECPWTERPWM